MRAAAFIRYHSGDGFGHVGWAFEVRSDLVDAGSVENHRGHLFTPASRMGFWNGCFHDAIVQMRERGYDDLKWVEVPNADPLLAYRTALWIRRNAYRVLHRNCEDDVYDVLRAYGVAGLPLPSLLWFPKSWFKRFAGTLEHLNAYAWPDAPDGEPEPAAIESAQPWQPTWRRPWHPHFHALKARRLRLLLPER